MCFVKFIFVCCVVLSIYIFIYFVGFFILRDFVVGVVGLEFVDINFNFSYTKVIYVLASKGNNCLFVGVKCFYFDGGTYKYLIVFLCFFV